MLMKKKIDLGLPFAVIQYYERLKFSGSDDCYKRYEMVYLNGDCHRSFHVLRESEIDFLKDNLNVIKLVLHNEHGKVYEFCGFKDYAYENEIFVEKKIVDGEVVIVEKKRIDGKLTPIARKQVNGKEVIVPVVLK